MALKRFFQGTVEPPSHLYGTALNRILASWTEDSVRKAAAAWDISNLLTREHNVGGILMEIPLSWDELTLAFLHACDNEFLSETIYEDLTKQWYNVRPKEGTTPADFFLDFNAAASAHDEVAKLKNLAPLTNREKIAQLLRVIPPYVRDALQAQLSDRDILPQSLDFQELRRRISKLWTYTPKPAALALRRGQATPAPAKSASALPAPGRQNDTRMRQCGLVVSYDTAPAVPPALRGSIYTDNARDMDLVREITARRNACISAGVCEYCRRPRSEHHAVSAQFKEIARGTQGPLQNRRGGPVHQTPRVRFADISGPRVEDVTDQ
ncbi:MAG TPA: hypothetical protein VLN58_16450, partial [Verrucomicrobiae bacterium]|nr:hypothetical protein [Verrucomicrobiae bacterium]